MRKHFIIALGLVLAATSTLSAQPPHEGTGGCQRGHQRFEGPGPCPGGHMMGKEMPGLRMILTVGDEINLTDEQRDRLEKMVVDFQIQKVDQEARVKKAKIRLKALMRDDDASESEVMSAIDEVGRLKAEMKKMHYHHFVEAKKALTGEQIDKLKQMRKEKKRPCHRRERG